MGVRCGVVQPGEGRRHDGHLFKVTQKGGKVWRVSMRDGGDES